MSLNFAAIVALLVVCTVVIATVIAAVRKPSWVTLLAVPFGLLVLLSIGTVTWSVAAPRYVAHQPDLGMGGHDVHLQQGDAFRMNHPPTSLSPDLFARWVMIGIPVMIGIALAVGIPVLCRKSIARHGNVVLPALALLGLGIVGVVIGGLFFVRTASLIDAPTLSVYETFNHVPAALPPTVVTPPVAAMTDDAFDAEAVHSTAGSLSAETQSTTATEGGEASPELPVWARGETIDVRELHNGVHQNTVVLVSDQWSSVQESEVQLEAMTARALQQQLLMDRGLYQWQPSKDFVHQSGAIQQRFVEQTSLKVGEFDTPMFRSYWQVSATPHVSELAMQEWKAAAVEERLTMLGAGAAILTLLFAGGAAGLRFDSATSGRYRRRMAAAVVAVGALAAGTAALFVA